ncbi:right-handed parallel beta-helix repeat-containing protein [Candidatus Saccharibacteria bacterium]|nr:right-handed parallel beta-helix repeat-containing protein [Candidatus Saccharibacteria bacterium]
MNRRVIISITAIIFAALITAAGQYSVSALTEVSSSAEIAEAIAGGEDEISIISDFDFTQLITLPANRTISIDGNDHMITRGADYKGGLFVIPNTSSLSIDNLKVEGGSKNWVVKLDEMHSVTNYYYRFPIDLNGDVPATASLFTNNGSLEIANSTFEHNASSVNASIVSNKGNLDISKSVFNKNMSQRSGGIIYSNAGSKVIIDNSTFTDNLTGTEENGGSGGILSITKGQDFKFTNSYVSNTVAQQNSSFASIAATNALIENNVFEYGHNGNDGGVMQISGANGVTGLTFISRNNIYRNNSAHAPAQSLGGVICFAGNYPTYDKALIESDTFDSNFSAATGGAISTYTYGSGDEGHTDSFNIEIVGSTFTNNKAGSGGAVHIGFAKGVTITNSVFKNNLATSIGGAIDAGHAGNLTISGSTISENEGRYIGGIYAYAIANIDIINTKVNHNTAEGFGGIYIANDQRYSSNTTLISGSEINNNTSSKGSGGGLSITSFKSGDAYTIEDTSITGNTSNGYGGGIAISRLVDSTVTISGISKIFNNSAVLGGDDLYIAKTPDAYADNPGTVRIIPVSDMDLATVDNWYVDSPDQRYSSDDGEIYGELNLSNTEPVYLKAAPDEPTDNPDQHDSSDDGEIYGELNLSNTEPVYPKAAPDEPTDNPQTGDNVTLAIFAIIGLMAGFGLMLCRSLRVRA